MQTIAWIILCWMEHMEETQVKLSHIYFIQHGPELSYQFFHFSRAFKEFGLILIPVVESQANLLFNDKKIFAISIQSKLNDRRSMENWKQNIFKHLWHQSRLVLFDLSSFSSMCEMDNLLSGQFAGHQEDRNGNVNKRSDHLILNGRSAFVHNLIKKQLYFHFLLPLNIKEVSGEISKIYFQLKDNNEEWAFGRKAKLFEADKIKNIKI